MKGAGRSARLDRVTQNDTMRARAREPGAWSLDELPPAGRAGPWETNRWSTGRRRI